MGTKTKVEVPDDVYLYRVNDHVQRIAEEIFTALRQEGWIDESKYDRDWRPQRLVGNLLREKLQQRLFGIVK